MRVAFLTPTKWNLCATSNLYSPEMIQEVIGIFIDQGLDVSHVRVAADETLRIAAIDTDRISLNAIWDLSRFFDEAKDYELIYNLCGIAPLLLSKITDTPMITLIDHDMYQNSRSAFEACSAMSHFLWIGEHGTAGHSLPGPVITLGDTNGENRTREFANQLLTAGKDLLSLLNREDHRPWGYYVVLSDLDDHKVKRIVVYPKKRLSLQSHKRRSEHWLVISGQGVVTLDSAQVELGPGQSVDIPVGTRHRMSNHGDDPVVFVEVQTGDYFGEDDIERYEDDFGRV